MIIIAPGIRRDLPFDAINIFFNGSRFRIRDKEAPAQGWICIQAESIADPRVERGNGHLLNNPLSRAVPEPANFQKQTNVAADRELLRRPGEILVGVFRSGSLV